MARTPQWRKYLEARGFVAPGLLWMYRDGFYIRCSKRSEPGKFATCSSAMDKDGAFRPTIKAAFAHYVAWLLTTSRKLP